MALEAAYQRLAERHTSTRNACLLLLCFLLLAVPLFVRMPPNVDVAFRQLRARVILRHAILEREITVFAPPGAVWIYTALMRFFGESVVVLRMFDLIVAGTVAALLVRWQGLAGLSAGGQAWLALVLTAFYLTTSEWCHCQTDLWMSLPALAGLHCRRIQTTRLATGRPIFSVGSAAVFEGVLWGSGCLLKPFVIVPGLFAYVTWLGIALRGRRSVWALLVDTAGLLIGGLLTAACWGAWLKYGGGWGDLQQSFVTWSGNYYAMTAPWLERLPVLFTAPSLMALVHLLAMPFAVLSVVRAFRGDVEACSDALLGACYLGWVIEGNFLQSQNYYHLVPGVLWGLALMAGPVARLTGKMPLLRVSLVGVLVAFLASQPALAATRLALWPRCWHEPTTPQLWDALAFDDHYPHGWQELERVADFLRSQEVRDRDVTCYSITTTHLYGMLNLRPTTRYPFLSLWLFMYPERQSMILHELGSSGHRFIVSNMCEVGWKEDEGQADTATPALPDTFPSAWAVRYPWCEPVVFRAGRYVVHRVRDANEVSEK